MNQVPVFFHFFDLSKPVPRDHYISITLRGLVDNVPCDVRPLLLTNVDYKELSHLLPNERVTVVNCRNLAMSIRPFEINEIPYDGLNGAYFESLCFNRFVYMYGLYETGLLDSMDILLHIDADILLTEKISNLNNFNNVNFLADIPTVCSLGEKVTYYCALDKRSLGYIVESGFPEYFLEAFSSKPKRISDMDGLKWLINTGRIRLDRDFFNKNYFPIHSLQDFLISQISLSGELIDAADLKVYQESGVVPNIYYEGAFEKKMFEVFSVKTGEVFVENNGNANKICFVHFQGYSKKLLVEFNGFIKN